MSEPWLRDRATIARCWTALWASDVEQTLSRISPSEADFDFISRNALASGFHCKNTVN